MIAFVSSRHEATILSGMLTSYMALAQLHLNSMLTTLTIVSTLLLPVSVIAGLWGMNFAVVPGADVAVRESRAERPARVLAIGQAVDPDTQTVPVRAEVTRPDHGLRPGQVVAVSILAVGADGTVAVSVPTAAVIRSGDAAYVFERSAGGVTVTPVTVVASADRRVTVRGIDAGARVARGVYFCRMQAVGTESGKTFSHTQKMVVVR